MIAKNNFLTATPNNNNPFRNLIPGASFNGATIAQSQLLRPFKSFYANRRSTAITYSLNGSFLCFRFLIG
ncbi:MAG: hypothetical protein J2P21_30325, partial [Chloracidobacterium sp.]|nr:hypothetical protein [Chloracidobacterium sp.]